jgi:hypothetical protein
MWSPTINKVERLTQQGGASTRETQLDADRGCRVGKYRGVQSSLPTHESVIQAISDNDLVCGWSCAQPRQGVLEDLQSRLLRLNCYELDNLFPAANKDTHKYKNMSTHQRCGQTNVELLEHNYPASVP